MITRILLIEDNPGDALIFREKLNASDLDYELVHTPRLQEGLDLLAQGDEFDILLCDLSLPDASGLEAVVKVRQAAPDRPLIVLTGLDDATAAAKAKSEGAADYLVKWYVDSVSLARYIRYAIAQYHPPVAPQTPQAMAVGGEVVAVADPSSGAGEGAPEPAGSPAPDAPTPSPLAAALDGASDGVAVVGEGRRVLYANRRARAWMGAGERFPWPTEAGTRLVRHDGQALELSAAPADWDGADAMVVTLRPAPASGNAPPAVPVTQAAEAALAFVDHVGRQTRWMGDVLRSALDLHRRDGGEGEPQPELVDLADLAQQTARELRPEALLRGLPLRVQAGRKKVVAYADRVLAGQVLHRLLLDAIHVADPGNGVDVAVAVDAERSTVEVAWSLLREARPDAADVVQDLAGAVAEGLARQLGGRLDRRGEPGRTVITLSLPGREDVSV